ncbi:MAG: hypothetical protein M0P44_02350 [Clostridiales bacterium]|jgi:hypothetical protein|nr:hypothetical protein [Clostridiales bacterium]MDD4186041.1 hypothetical protein [Eubacteriales bacterium]MDY0119909.1 hypothetical protein [Clostridia bacterium]
MLRAIVLIDHQNFEIAVWDLYGGSAPWLDDTKLPKQDTRLVPGYQLIKTYLFVPKPDTFSKDISNYSKAYQWAKGLNSKPFS